MISWIWCDFFFSCSRHCFTNFSKRDPNYLISDLWNFYSNYLWNFLILVHWCQTIPSGETLCWFERIGQRKESQVGWRSQTFHVESWGKFPFPVLWKRIHAISSYKDHLYKVQVLNPPEFKDLPDFEKLRTKKWKLFYNLMKIIDFETSKLACPWILGVLIVLQFFPIFANIFLKIQGNKDH